MSPDENRRKAVAFWIEKAHRSLDSAQAEVVAGRVDFAVNRCYFAAFYAATAALLSRGQRFRKHAGVRGALHQQLVKPGLLSPDWGRLYDRLFEDRQRGDYLDLVTFDPEEVAELIPKARELVAVIECLVVNNESGAA
jgi:uncharacterized protein (UPF0332 family)